VRVPEKVVQGGVAPVNALDFGEVFEAAQVCFAQVVAGFLVIWVAIVDAAGQGPWLAGGAEVAFLEGAKIRGDGGRVIRGSVVQEDLGFEVAEEEGVAEFLEAAAAATGDAHRPGCGYFAVNLTVQLKNLAACALGH
jgi:hypothetical protein